MFIRCWVGESLLFTDLPYRVLRMDSLSFQVNYRRKFCPLVLGPTHWFHPENSNHLTLAEAQLFGSDRGSYNQHRAFCFICPLSGKLS